MTLRFPEGIHDPRELPELREVFVEMTKPGGMWERWEVENNIVDLAGPIGYNAEQLPHVIEDAMTIGRDVTAWHHMRFQEAQLIYITEELTEVIESARVSVPDSHVLTYADLPCPCGLAVFARPVMGIDSQSRAWALDEDVSDMHGYTLKLHAVMWGPVKLPKREHAFTAMQLQDHEYPIEAITMSAFRLISPTDQDDAAKALREVAHQHDPDNVARLGQEHVWIPLGRSDWPLGDPVNVPISKAIDPNSTRWESMMDDRKLMSSMWAIMQQKRLVEAEQLMPPRHIRRQIARRFHREVERGVQVVHLRRPEYRPTVMEGDEVGTGRKHKVRYPVRPFFRQQAYGKNRELRKLILVPPHWRGPVDGPVVHTERIWELDR